MKQKYKRKVKRQVKDLESFEEYQQNPSNFLSDENQLKLNTSYKRFCLYKINKNFRIFLSDFKN